MDNAFNNTTFLTDMMKSSPSYTHRTTGLNCVAHLYNLRCQNNVSTCLSLTPNITHMQSRSPMTKQAMMFEQSEHGLLNISNICLLTFRFKAIGPFAVSVIDTVPFWCSVLQPVWELFIFAATRINTWTCLSFPRDLPTSVPPGEVHLQSFLMVWLGKHSACSLALSRGTNMPRSYFHLESNRVNYRLARSVKWVYESVWGSQNLCNPFLLTENDSL